MKEPVSPQLVKYLEARGVKHIFGLCGHTNIAFLAALSKSDKIKFINVRHEQIAAHAADGYARVTKKASVLLTHLGPGLINAATGVANAALDSIPMVVIAGDVPSHYFGKHPHQEVNMYADGDQWEVTGLLLSAHGESIVPRCCPKLWRRRSPWQNPVALALFWSMCRWTYSLKKSMLLCLKDNNTTQNTFINHLSITTWPPRSSRYWWKPRIRFSMSVAESVG